MTCDNEAASRALIKAKSLQVSVDESEQVASDGISSIKEQLDQMCTILKGANFKPNNGFKLQKTINRTLGVNSRGLGHLLRDVLERAKDQCNVTAVMGGGIINNSVLVRNPLKVVKNGQI